jgi:hypothetical protein
MLHPEWHAHLIGLNSYFNMYYIYVLHILITLHFIKIQNIWEKLSITPNIHSPFFLSKKSLIFVMLPPRSPTAFLNSPCSLACLWYKVFPKLDIHGYHFQCSSSYGNFHFFHYFWLMTMLWKWQIDLDPLFDTKEESFWQHCSTII